MFIKTEGIKKAYKNFFALKKLDICIKRGDIFSLIGPNGAGKTTTLKILSTLQRPTTGTGSIFGLDIIKDRKEIREKISLISETVVLHENLTAYENLKFFGDLYDIEKKKLAKRINELLELINMNEWKDKKIRIFSRGMKQRINIAAGFLKDPEIVFLDEPTLGLDIQTTIIIRNFLKKKNEEGITMIISSHLLSEIEKISNRIGIIDNGVLLCSDELSKLIEEYKSEVGITLNVVPVNRIDFEKFLKDKKIDSEFEDGLFKLKLNNSSLLHTKEIMFKNNYISEIYETKPTLEDIYLWKTG